MSSPPPGGPQPPPQQYPQQPYPQPPYPQQPYYTQPVAPPPKKSNTALIIVLIVVVVVVVVVAVAWYAFTLMFRPVTTSYTINSVSLAINYPGPNHYFGATPITSCSACPITVSITSPQTYSFTLTNHDSAQHNVTGIALSGLQFVLVSSTPDPTLASPTTFAAGASTTFTLTITATGFSGNGVLSGTISTN